MITEAFIHELEQKHYSIEKIVYTNEAKGRICAEAKDFTGNKVFVKYNDKTEPAFYETIQKECGIYRALSGKEWIPGLKVAENGLLITEFIQDGKTLRKSIIDYMKDNTGDVNTIGNIIDSTYSDYADMIKSLAYGYNLEKSGESAESRNSIRMAVDYLAKLLMSGPMDNKKTNKAIMIRNKVLFRLFRYRINMGFRFRRFSQMDYGIIHGDYHANNLIYDGKKVFIIDYENVNFGVAEYELAYYTAQVHRLLDGDKNLQRATLNSARRTISEMKLNEKCFDWILNIYIKSIRFNPRFYY